MESGENLQASVSPGPAQISEMLSALLSNRELLETIKKAVPPAAFASDPKPTEPSLPVQSGGLETVLSSPALMAALPSLMAQLAPMMSGLNAPSREAPAKKKSPEECRNDLLCALRPFLSSERQSAIDTLIRISALGALIRQMK